MKKISLTIKIWLFLTAITTVLFITYSLIFPALLRDSLGEPGPKGRYSFSSLNHIQSILLLDDGTILSKGNNIPIPEVVIDQGIDKAFKQQAITQNYTIDNESNTYRYQIQKLKMDDDETVYYVINFFDRKVEDRFINFMFQRVMQFAIVALIVCWFLALFAARYLTRPLIQMEQYVKRLANKDKKDPLILYSNDEFGQLAESIESMRQQLLQQEAIQQTLLQNISHELKTPVMVMQGYVQSLLDGVYPPGDQTRVLGILEKECGHMEFLIKQLLYLSMLDYISTQSQNDKDRIAPLITIKLNEIINKTAQRFYHRRPEIRIVLDLDNSPYLGNEDQWRVVTENLIDNHLRYASTTVSISLQKRENGFILKVHNDGLPINAQIRKSLFQPFIKDKEGKCGLGLTIVHRIVEMNEGKLDVINENDGVSTIITI